MVMFSYIVVVTLVSIITFLQQDVCCIHRRKDDSQIMRANHLSEAIETLFGSDDKTSKKVLFYFPVLSSSIDTGLIRAYGGSYEVCRRNLFKCVKNDFELMNRVVVVNSREGFQDLVKRFPVSFELGLDLIKIVIWDERHDAWEVCKWVGTAHNATVAAGRDGVRPCFGRKHPSPRLRWSALSGRNVSLGCGTVRRSDLCTTFRVKVFVDALAVINATVDYISFNDIDLISTRHKVDALGLLTIKYDQCPAFFIEPELWIDISVYVYVEEGKMQQNNFVTHLVWESKIAAFSFLCCISVAVLCLLVNERLTKNRLDDLVLLLISLFLGRAVPVLSECIRQHSRRVLLSFWALGCLVLVVYVQCLLTSRSTIPIKAELKDFIVVVDELSADPGAKICTTGEGGVYSHGDNFEVLVKKIAREDTARDMNEVSSCIRHVYRVKRGAAVLTDKVSCEIKRELGGNMFKVSRNPFALHGGIPISRSSSRKLALKAILRRIFETGWFEGEHIRATRTCPTVPVETEVYISLRIFIVPYLCCCTACVLVCLIERIGVMMKALLK